MIINIGMCLIIPRQTWRGLNQEDKFGLEFIKRGTGKRLCEDICEVPRGRNKASDKSNKSRFLMNKVIINGDVFGTGKKQWITYMWRAEILSQKEPRA